MNRTIRVAAVASAMLLIFARISIAAQGETKNEVPLGGWVASFVDLAYPVSALNAKVQGAVVIRATLDDDGNGLEVFALSGSRALIPDCLSNAKQWKFKPNKDRMATIVYDFEIKEGECHDASRSLFQLFGPLAKITACTRVE